MTMILFTLSPDSGINNYCLSIKLQLKRSRKYNSTLEQYAGEQYATVWLREERVWRWVESWCVDCPVGRYGPACEHKCACKGGASCDRDTGRCRCAPGSYGPTCADRCPAGRFGDKCSVTAAAVAGVDCNAITGECSCPPGFTGDTCQRGEFVRFRYSTHTHIHTHRSNGHVLHLVFFCS